VRALLLLAALSGCWTGASPEPAPVIAPPEPARATPYLRVRLERTICTPECLTILIEIDGARRVARRNSSNDGDGVSRAVRLSAEDIRTLDRAIVESRFFDRDEHGALPAKPVCTSDGSTTTCSISGIIAMCSDPLRAVLTVSRGIRSHAVDFELCNEIPEITELTRLVERLARARPPGTLDD
jgi:hypothetical protein